jgi:hypothetical protein
MLEYKNNEAINNTPKVCKKYFGKNGKQPMNI